MIAQGGIITLLGMTVVFAFLATLVGILKLLALVSPRTGSPPSPGGPDRRMVAAITAAYAAEETRRGRNG